MQHEHLDTEPVCTSTPVNASRLYSEVRELETMVYTSLTSLPVPHACCLAIVHFYLP
jgi:hypothetical protein